MARLSFLSNACWPVHVLAWLALTPIATLAPVEFFRRHGYFELVSPLATVLARARPLALVGLAVGVVAAATALPARTPAARARVHAACALLAAFALAGWLWTTRPDLVRFLERGPYPALVLLWPVIYALAAHRAAARDGGRLRAATSLAAVIGLACAAAPLLLSLSRPQRPPSVLIVSVDALRPANLNVYGYDVRVTSPAIDAFAKDAVRFERAFAQSSWTKTSVASLFTGLYPSNHGVFRGVAHIDRNATSDVLNPAAYTLAERLRDHGYRTFGYVCGIHPIPELGFAQGFDTYLYRRTSNDEAVRALDRYLALSDGPFFGYVHLFGVHWQYDWDVLKRAAAESSIYSVERARSLFESIAFKFDRAVEGDVDIQRIRLTVEEQQALRVFYDWMIRHVDGIFAEILEILERAGRGDDTLVILTADHGEMLGARGLLWHGWGLYNSTIHVPLLLSFPGRAHAGRVVDTPVAAVDLMPTILDSLPLEDSVEIETDGRSLMLAVRGETFGERPILAEWKSFDPVTGELRHDVKALVENGRKLICDLVSGEAELYDLDRDFQESHDLLEATPRRDTDPGVEWVCRRVVEAVGSITVRPLTAEETEIDDELVDRMRTLGYLE